MSSTRSANSSKSRLFILILVVVLLFLHLFLRTHHLLAQPGYVDEGGHSLRGAIAWRLDKNPGWNSDGKFLLYYYIGLFEAESTTAMFVSRAAIALFSLITAAVVYQLGRTFHSNAAGLLAMGLYGVLPFTFFHERMALADPFAAGFSAIVAWRSLIFAHHPTLRQGLILGVLLALATMAKLTLGVLPFLTVAATIICFPQIPGTHADRVRYWLRTYFPPLLLAAIVMIVLWLPILIPALISNGTSQPFKLVDSVNVAQSSATASNPLVYAVAILKDTAEYTTPALFVVALLATVVLLANPKHFEATFFLVFWLAVTSLLTFGFASLVAARYLVPAAAPVVLLIGIAAADLWRRFPIFWMRGGLVAATTIWLLTFSLPFIAAGITNPAKMPLTGANYGYYLGTAFTSDETLLQTAHVLDNIDPLIRVDPSIKVIYGDWVVCRLIYYFVRQPVKCLEADSARQQLVAYVQADLAPGESAYLVRLDTGTTDVGVEGTCPTPFVRFTRANAFSVDIWRLQRAPCASK